LGGVVVEKQDGIEELGEIFDADSGQSFEDFAGNEVIARVFFWFELADNQETRNRQYREEEGKKLVAGPRRVPDTKTD
jgi:hypothetical protein